MRAPRNRHFVSLWSVLGLLVLGACDSKKESTPETKGPAEPVAAASTPADGPGEAPAADAAGGLNDATANDVDADPEPDDAADDTAGGDGGAEPQHAEGGDEDTKAAADDGDAREPSSNEDASDHSKETKTKPEPKPEPKPKSQPKSDGGGDKAGDSDSKSAAVDGKAVYLKKCKNCHGVKGDADTKIGKKHDIPSWKEPGWKSKWTQAKVVDIVTTGEPGTKMKPFKDKLTPEEIQAVSKYARSLGK